eukprot:TRINITY_DN57222_c0_g1_i1.p1 TRINITY_DN57222_c0_g1~~TRINITY_DN57222_c0_g1_i1.p1  ORF type:complete len:268 (+),score=34.16 TRINITY_DN57222_c0_g1_i1:73-876(+)
MGTCCSICGDCWSGVLASSGGRRKNRQDVEGEGRWVWHGSMPMFVTDVTEGGLPQYVGMVDHEEMVFGPMKFSIETWPDYRIGSMHWPSGRLLARAFAEGALPSVLPPVAGRHVVELGAGPGLPGLVACKLGAASVTLTDLVELVPLMNNNIRHNSVEAVCRADTLDWLGAGRSRLAAANRGALGPLDIILAADVVYVEEQEPLMGALLALMAPGHTKLVLAYKNRNPGDRAYLNERILPRLDGVVQAVFGTPEDGETEIYVGTLRV